MSLISESIMSSIPRCVSEMALLRSAVSFGRTGYKHLAPTEPEFISLEQHMLSPGELMLSLLQRSSMFIAHQPRSDMSQTSGSYAARIHLPGATHVVSWRT